MLGSIRVLEISAPGTMLAGQILGDLGADVVTLEAPGGAAGRRLPPFIAGRLGLEQSLTWHALNRNKRGLTLDIRSDDGRSLLQELLPRFDIVIEEPDGESIVDAAAVPANLIVCRVAPFSRTGPKARYRASDPVLMAAGGAPAMTGPPDRPPLFFPVPQAMFEAGAEAAVAALSALAARDRPGEGQIVDVQARIATMPGSLARLVSGQPGERGHGREDAPPPGAMPLVPWIYACSDGYAIVNVSFTPAFAAMTNRIAAWLVQEGALDAEVAELDFVQAARRAAKSEDDGREIRSLVAALISLCKTKSKAAIAEIASTFRFMAAPVMTMADIAAFEHYRERGLFAPQDINGRTVQAPARFAQFSDYQIDVTRPAPSLSQHTAEILSEEIGLSRAEVEALFAQGIL